MTRQKGKGSVKGKILLPFATAVLCNKMGGKVSKSFSEEHGQSL